MNPFMLSNILESMVGIGQNWGHIQKKTHLSRVLVQCDMVEKKERKLLTLLYILLLGVCFSFGATSNSRLPKYSSKKGKQ